MKIHSAFLTVVLIGVSGAAMAQWQWLDRDGRRVFSDRGPPPDVMEKDILKRPGGGVRAAVAKDAAKDVTKSDGTAPADEGAANAAAAAPGGGLDKELQARKKQAAEAEAAKRRAEEERITKLHIENCARAKQAIASLDSGLRIARAGANGEREVLDDAGRAAERAQLQKSVDSECR